MIVSSTDIADLVLHEIEELNLQGWFIDLMGFDSLNPSYELQTRGGECYELALAWEPSPRIHFSASFLSADPDLGQS